MKNGDQNKPDSIEASDQLESGETRSISADNGADGTHARVDPEAQPKRARGALRGNSNAMKHGMSRIDLDYGRRKPVDKRTRSGRIENQVLQALVNAYGGPEQIGTRLKILI